MAGEKSVVLCSGGLNSAVAAAIIVKESTAALLHVRYGNRAAEREEALFEKQADFFGVKERLVVDLPHLAVIGGNARVSRNRQVEDALAVGEGPCNCYVPGLIGTLVNVGLSWASTIGASKIVLGVSEDLGPPAPKTRSVFPDYSREFLLLCNHLVEDCTRHRPITVDAPIIDLKRSEIIKIGNRLNAPLDQTWSCLSSGSEPCGGCIGCATRSRGFLDAGIPDPLLLVPARV